MIRATTPNIHVRINTHHNIQHNYYHTIKTQTLFMLQCIATTITYISTVSPPWHPAWYRRQPSCDLNLELKFDMLFEISHGTSEIIIFLLTNSLRFIDYNNVFLYLRTHLKRPIVACSDPSVDDNLYAIEI